MCSDRRLVVIWLAWIVGVGCGDSPPKGLRQGDPPTGDASADAGATDGATPGDRNDGSVTGADAGRSTDADAGLSGFDVEPSDVQTLRVDTSASPPTLTFTATLDGTPIAAGWNVDRGEIGSIEAGDDGTAIFTPSGTTGGLVTVRAGLNGEVVERQVWVELSSSQNGANADSEAQQRQVAEQVDDLKAGGGVGGVGGEGLGGAVEDEAVRDSLEAPTGDATAQNLELLYPYDGTVWPRGLLAPLLMWRSDLGSVDAIRIELRTTSGSFQWAGNFAAPEILADTGGDFVRHPIPQDAWTMATDTAGGRTPDGSVDQLELRLTVAKGDEAYGPVTQTWTVAPGRLSGTIYYSSYGTNLAKNYDGAVGGDGRFGGAVLSIRVGDTAPSLVAGTDGDSSDCRVCHSVSADGGRLFAVPGDYDGSRSYVLSPSGATEEDLDDVVEYPGLTRDGRYALTPDAELLDLDNAGATVTISGLTDVATELGTPSFSYDGTRVVFNPMASASLTDPRRKLVVMDFDEGAMAFANALTVVDNTGPAEERPGWPNFTPDGHIVYHQQIEAGVDGNDKGALHTRKGAKAYLAWTPANDSAPAPLNRLNGLDEAGDSYLPSLPSPVSLSCTADGASVGGIDADHADDANLNYEPTVNPVASGGYSWVVFTSRRMYGNVATIPPFCSDPRGVDLIENITPKKLWVAALDLNGTPGTDISHPAFYLPAQELLAGNTRGSWVLDPCRADGDSCETGDQCCNGFCTPDDDGALICANEPPEGQCSQLQERCETAADCCDPDHSCINQFCSYVILQ